MYVKLVLALTVFCAVISKTKSERSNDARAFMQPGYARMKRGKYYSYPQKIYSRPPVSFPDRGVFSYTPPPSYTLDVNELPYPGRPGTRPSKVSKRPTNNGLDNDDISNIINNLSKKDLAKLIGLVGGKESDSEMYSSDPFQKQYTKTSKDNFKNSYEIKTLHDFDSEKYSSKPINDEDTNIFKALIKEIDSDLKDTPYQHEPTPFSVEYNRQPITKPFQVEYDSKPEPKPFREEYDNKPESEPFKIEYNIRPTPEQTPSRIEYEYNNPSMNYVTQPTPPQIYNKAISQNNQLYDTATLEAEETMLKNQIAFLKSQIRDGVVYTDSQIMPDETLPKPMNLRDDQDFDVSYTNNVPTIVKADQSSSYKLENFGDLPLMNYNAKLDTRSSYHVPHYTVTSGAKPSPLSSYSAPSPYSASSSVPAVEPAPPPSAAKAQSDAHLKAVRIWSHKSQGTAYTLHNDGTLSLERPGRPKGSYGHPYN